MANINTKTIIEQTGNANPHVYITEISDITEGDFAQLLTEIPSWRVEKTMKFKYFQGRKECAVSFFSLQKALREDFGITGEITFDYDEHGKPSLKNHTGVHFNISHCKKAVACAVSDVPIGIDVEMLGRYEENLARHVLNEDELARVQASENPDQTFIEYWTRKEAVLKLIGTGICDDIKDVLVENKDKKITTTVCDGYVYSVAVKTN